MGRTAAKVIAVILAMVLIFTLFISLFGMSLNKATANEWKCVFAGGPFEGKGLKNTVAPGKSGGLTVWDTSHTVPSDIRFYIIDEDPNTADYGAQKIELPAQGNITVREEVQLRFKFSEQVCTWYAEHGKRNEPLSFNGEMDNSQGGWARFLNLSIWPFIYDVSRDQLANYDYKQLSFNSPVESNQRVYDVLEDEIQKTLMASLKTNLGDNFFCGPSYTYDGSVDGQFDCPPIEVTVKSVRPVNAELLANEEKKQANLAQQELIESDKNRDLAQIQAQQERELAEAARKREVEVAQAQTDQDVRVAQAQAQTAVAREQLAQREAELAAARLQAEANAAYCAELAKSGVDCALLKAAENSDYPQFGSQPGNIIVDGRAAG